MQSCTFGQRAQSPQWQRKHSATAGFQCGLKKAFMLSQPRAVCHTQRTQPCGGPSHPPTFLRVQTCKAETKAQTTVRAEASAFSQQSDMERADKSSDQSPSNAKVAENTDGKPLGRERSEDGLCLILVVLQSISFVLTSPTNRKLDSAEIDHCF